MGASSFRVTRFRIETYPVRFNYDDNYFNHKFQEYQNLVIHKWSSPLSNTKISLLNYVAPSLRKCGQIMIMFFQWRAGCFYSCQYGRLEYRTLDFKNNLPE